MLGPLLERCFELSQRHSTIGREFRGASATFLTMAYILLVNPSILKSAGVPEGSAVACTALAAGVCSILMGLGANFPIALASGMGLNAVVAFQIAPHAGSWQTAMGLVFWDGLIVAGLVLCGLREAVLHAIPRDLRRAIGAGIGLFIAFIGAVHARLVIVPGGTLAALQQDPGAAVPPVTFGDLSQPETQVALAGLLATALLLVHRIKGALILGIGVATVLAHVLGVARWPETFDPPSFDNLFQADLTGALQLKLVPFLFAMLMVDFFDTLGTVTALADQSNLASADGNIPHLRRILLIDAMSASIGGLCGVSSVTSYIESASGVAEGARTGLHSVFVGLFFLAAILLAPLAVLVPPSATAPALILVGFLMTLGVTRIEFSHLETGIPAFLTLIFLPLTYSIAHGIGIGFVTYTVIQMVSGKWRQVHPLMYGSAAMFALYFVLGDDARPLYDLLTRLQPSVGN